MRPSPDARRLREGTRPHRPAARHPGQAHLHDHRSRATLDARQHHEEHLPMNLETALQELLKRYIAAVRQAEEAGDYELVAVLLLRRDRLSRLQGLRYTAERRRQEVMQNQYEGYRRLEGEGC
jgi:hypothetical protein